ncbi:MAG: ABC transporter ATP-binding protein [Acidiferrobacterales bacterium]|nr:ABC transporter ATP-binding protein [Acidiferrobacterales bacterium]
MNDSNSAIDRTGTQPLLAVCDVSLSYGNGRRAVNAVSFELQPGEMGSILGPSGCGKSTLLRGIAGFEPLHAGSITMNSATLSSPGNSVAPEKRNIGLMFQDYALFPHLSVSQNISFGLRKWKAADRDNRVRSLLMLIDLEGFGDRDPYSLSGGEQQRIALARAIAPKPELLLMDEPFSSLDVEIRNTLIPEVKRILTQENISTIMVTHNHEIAFSMADKIGIMEKGYVHQWDVPFNVYHHPLNRFTARFVGEGEFISADVISDQMLRSAFGLHAFQNDYGLKRDAQVEILLRPDDILHDDASELTGKVIRKSFRGSHFLYTVRLEDGQSIYCLADSHHNHQLGEHIGLRLNIEHIVIFEKGQEHAMTRTIAPQASSPTSPE